MTRIGLPERTALNRSTEGSPHRKGTFLKKYVFVGLEREEGTGLVREKQI